MNTGNIKESHVKNAVKKLFTQVNNPDMLYFYMSVPGRYGTSTLDFIGVYKGVPFAVETKAPGKKPTGRQEKIKREMLRAGINVFIIDNTKGPGINLLSTFLNIIDVERAIPNDTNPNS